MKMQNNQKKNIYTVFGIVLLLLAIAQLGVVLYVNLFQMKYHMGYDVSSYMTKAIEIWKQKTFFIDHWHHQTTLYMDNAMTIAVFLYGMTHDIFISYGIANCIVTGLLVALFLSICKEFNFSRATSLLCLNIFLCPFLIEGLNNWNDLGYFSMMFTSMASYGVKTVTIFLVVKVTLLLEREKKSIILPLLSLFLCFIAGLSSGYYVAVTVVIPCVLYIGIHVLVRNNWKELWNRQTAFVCSSGALVFIGKFISEKIMHFESSDSEMVWTALGQFWTNLSSIFVGFLQLLNALPLEEGKYIMNRQGIIYIFPYFIVMVCVLAVCIAIVSVLKKYEENRRSLLLLLVVVFNVFLFSIVYTNYGGRIFEERYLIEAFIAIILLVGVFIHYLGDGLIFKGLLYLGIIGSVLMINIRSDYNYTTTLNNYDVLLEITQKVADMDSPVVYLLGDDIMCEQRNLRAIDSSKVYKSFTSTGNVHHYGDYTYYDENGEYSGSTIMVTTDACYETIPNYIKRIYTYYDEVGQYKIYVSKKNILDNMAGITEFSYNVDFPYTRGLEFSNGSFHEEDGTYVTDGTEGAVLRGPYQECETGIYDITLHYEIKSSKSQQAGIFAVVTEDEDNILAQEVLLSNTSSVTLKAVKIEHPEELFGYRLDETAGTKLSVSSIEITRKN